jgi:hypothetical protein
MNTLQATMSNVTPLEGATVPEARDDSQNLLENVASVRESPPAARQASADSREDDNIFALIPRTEVLKVGASLPTFSHATLSAMDRSKKHTQQLNIVKSSMMVIHGSSPSHLHTNLRHKEWGDNSKLKKYFPLTNKRTGLPLKKSFNNFPICLLGLCATTKDRLIAINAWLNMTPPDRSAFAAVAKAAFASYSFLDSSLIEDVPKIKYTGILDSAEDRQQHVKASASHNLLATAKSQRKPREPPSTVSQMNDRHVHNAKRQVEERMKALMDMSTPIPRTGAIAEPAGIWMRNVQTPSKHGRPDQDRQILERPKTDLYVRNGSALMQIVNLFGPVFDGTKAIETPSRQEQVALELLKTAGVAIHTADNSENWPGAVRQKIRGRKRALTLEEVVERNGVRLDDDDEVSL